MTTLAGLDQHLAQGINLLYFLPAGLTALPAHLKNGYVEKGLLFPAISAGLLCAALASWAATALDVDLLRKLFGGFLILIGLSELDVYKRQIYVCEKVLQGLFPQPASYYFSAPSGAEKSQNASSSHRIFRSRSTARRSSREIWTWETPRTLAHWICVRFL